MKFKALLLLAGALSGGSAIAVAEVQQRDADFQAFAAMSSQTAAYLFVLEQYLDARCGRPQSRVHMQAVFRRDESNALLVILALKDGDLKEAKAILERLPCEQ